MNYEERLEALAKLNWLQQRATVLRVHWELNEAAIAQLDRHPTEDPASDEIAMGGMLFRRNILTTLSDGVLKSLQEITKKIGIPFAGVRVPDAMPEGELE